MIEIMTLLLPATQDIDATIVEELAFIGGTVSDRFDDGERLFLRALLPMSDEVRPKDIVEAGIAVRTVGQQIDVCPYLFRQVCRNGAIMPQLAEIQHVERVDLDAPSETIEAVYEQLREAVRACSAAEVFATAAQQLRAAAIRDIGSDFFQLLLLSSVGRMIPAGRQTEIMRRFIEAADQTAFGLMNAVTSVARDEKNPETRWRLEELGGGVPAMRFDRVRPGGSEAELVGAEA
jgi:hypothetical protein